MSCSSALPDALGWVAVGSYGALAAVLTVLAARMAWRDRRVTVQLCFLGLMMVFLGLRISYFVLKVGPDLTRTAATFALNRLAFGFYFSALALVLFYWAEQSHRTIIDERFQFLPGIKRWFFAVCGTVWAYQLVVLAVWLAGEQGREGDALYDSNVLVDECLAFLVAIGFAVYGLRLFLMLRREGQELDLGTTGEARLFLAGALAMLLLFSLRVVVFLWHFVTDVCLPTVIFYLFGYLLPEVLPAALHTFVMRHRKRAGSEGKHYIDTLYAQQDSQEIASFLLKSENTNEESFVRRDMESPAPAAHASPILPSAPTAGALSLDLSHDDFEET